MKRPPSKRKSPPKPRGRKKATSISVQSEKQISALRTRFRLQGTLLTYRDVRAALNSKYGLGLSVGTVYRMGQGHMPKSPTTRRALGLTGKNYDYDGWRAANIDKLRAIVAWEENR